MLKKYLLKIFKSFFTKKHTALESFELNLAKNNLIESFESNATAYIANFQNKKVIIRDYNHSDYAVFKQIFNFEEYKTVLSLIKLNFNIENEQIIIDAGANVGYTSLYFLEQLPKVKIFGIEPFNTNMTQYKENIKINNFEKQVVFYENALSEIENKSYIIDTSFRDGKDWSISTVATNEGNVKGITLDEIIQKNALEKIAVLKIDIEGAERFIFNRGNNLDFLNITQIIAIEIHDEFEIRSQINTLLQEHDFMLFESGELTIGVNKKLIEN
jgi:FkbM family methyltransferase